MGTCCYDTNFALIGDVSFQCYEPFFADFGPLNLGLTYRFCTKLDALLQVISLSVLPVGAAVSPALSVVCVRDTTDKCEELKLYLH